MPWQKLVAIEQSTTLIEHSATLNYHTAAILTIIDLLGMPSLYDCSQGARNVTKYSLTPGTVLGYVAIPMYPCDLGTGSYSLVKHTSIIIRSLHFSDCMTQMVI